MKRYSFVFCTLMAGLLMASCGSNSGKNNAKADTPVGDLALFGLNPQFPVESVETTWNGYKGEPIHFDDRNRCFYYTQEDVFSSYQELTQKFGYSLSLYRKALADSSFPVTRLLNLDEYDDGFAIAQYRFYDKMGRCIGDYDGGESLTFYSYNQNNQIETAYSLLDRVLYTYDSNGNLIQESFYSPKSDGGTFDGPDDPAELTGYILYTNEKVDAKGNWTKRSSVNEQNIGTPFASSNASTESRIIRYKDSNLPISPALR